MASTGQVSRMDFKSCRRNSRMIGDESSGLVTVLRFQDEHSAKLLLSLLERFDGSLSNPVPQRFHSECRKVEMN